MSKIKLNIDNGTVIEKKFITAFQTPEGKYVIFDDENLGTMGLPIILVSKIIDNKVFKIEDQGEWQQVKEYLKSIIAGDDLNYIKLETDLLASEVYFTQLTLPVPSFDALKTNYKIETSTPEVSPVQEVAPLIEEPTIPTVEEPAPIILEPLPEVSSIPNIVMPEETELTAPVIEEAPAIPEPIINNPIPEAPVYQEPIVEQTPVMPTTVIEESTPVMEPQFGPTLVKEEDPYQEMRESFLEACENVFDAMVLKLEKKE